jgi:SAM-dependent methyltransferase
MNLYDILGCPVCRNAVQRTRDVLRCERCERRYPIVQDVPIMLPEPQARPVAHEGPLQVRDGYDPWVHRMIIQSLTDAQVVVDAGCGNMALDDPCIIRMDSVLTPHVDVVGDIHAMPFRANSLDFVLALAVVEHLHQPFVAAASVHDALKPGGYVYAESNFVFAYHGYPNHFFNASIHGLESVFGRFRPLRVGVAPFQMPSFALESVLGTYLAAFRATTAAEERFAELLRVVLEHPLQHYDGRIDPADAFRIAAGGYFCGLKQRSAAESVIPRPVLDAWEADPAVRARYPERDDLTLPDNLMMWARDEGRLRHPAIAAWFEQLEPFVKSGSGRGRDAIRSLPPIPDPRHVRAIAERDPVGRETTATEHLRRLAGPTVRIASDGLPLPPARFVHAVVGTEDQGWFLESGKLAAANIRHLLAGQGVAPERLGAVLDFGCGVGRVMRHWAGLDTPELFGTDYNDELVTWCREHLPFARFAVNEAAAALPYASATFDLVYAFSVFTHLDEAQQRFWIDELARLLRPGGHLYLTTHGEAYFPEVPAHRQEAFRRGELVVCGEELAGTNVCAAFHPEGYVRDVLAQRLALVAFAPAQFPQDAYLFRKPE